jgi:hypothetical protein
LSRLGQVANAIFDALRQRREYTSVQVDRFLNELQGLLVSIDVDELARSLESRWNTGETFIDPTVYGVDSLGSLDFAVSDRSDFMAISNDRTYVEQNCEGA